MRLGRLAGPVLLLAVTVACVREASLARVGPGTAPSPGVPWTPSQGLSGSRLPATAPTAIPADLLKSAQHWGLGNLVDLALRNSPRTREAWAQARSAAAAMGAERGAYYPSIGLQVDRTTIKGSAVGGLFSFRQRSIDGTASLTWLLWDCGGRSASIEMARQALIAADWSHNAVIQDVVLDVERAYYQYQYARALLESQRTNVKEAQTNLDAATERRESGVATIADVLKSRTALSQSQLELESTEGQIQTIKGALATAVGLPANTRYEVEPPADDIPTQAFTDEVDRLIEQAERTRPDLAAARSRAAEAEARVRTIRSSGLPSLVTNWSAGTIYYLQSGSANSTTVETYNGALLLRIPIFNGFALQYDLLRARADAEAANASRDSLTQDVVSQVWTSYYGVKTAEKRVETSRDLLESAGQSYEVTLGRYKAGVGSILDLLTSQAALDDARAQRAQAQADWRLALVQLSHDTGKLDVSPPTGDQGAP